MSINKQIILLTISIILSLSVLFIISVNVTLTQRYEDDIKTMKKVLLEERKQQLKDLTANAYSVVSTANFYDDAIKAINGMRFGVKGKNYFFVFDTQGYFYTHPDRPEMVGKIHKKSKNSEGRFIFNEMIDKAEKKGSGFIEYMWPKPGGKNPVKKLTYFKIFKEWKWIIATGLYINDIDKAIAVKESKMKQELNHKMITLTTFMFIILTIMCFISTFLAGRISKPLVAAADKMRDIAEGEADLTTKLKIQSKDEVGNLASWFNIFIDNQRLLIKKIYDNAETVSSSSSRLLSSSTRVSDNADDTKNKADSVNCASEIMNGNMISAAAAMEQASTNVQNITSATFDMKNSIADISKTSEITLGITKKAVEQSETISGTILKLGKAAREIDDVTQVITDISEKTNLLALNATIESARAGEAGRSFGVVAKEIKSLAHQTKEATVKINQRIDGIKKSADGTAGEVKGITGIISDINDMVSGIADTSIIQSERSVEIAGNVTQIATSIEEINKNVSNSSIESSNIEKEISVVNKASGFIASESSTVKQDAESLLLISEKLKTELRRFKF